MVENTCLNNSIKQVLGIGTCLSITSGNWLRNKNSYKNIWNQSSCISQGTVLGTFIACLHGKLKKKKIFTISLLLQTGNTSSEEYLYNIDIYIIYYICIIYIFYIYRSILQKNTSALNIIILLICKGRKASKQKFIWYKYCSNYIIYSSVNTVQCFKFSCSHLRFCYCAYPLMNYRNVPVNRFLP